MITTKGFKKSELKAEIIKKYGSVSNLKKLLKSTAKNGTSEVVVYGCRISYTSNENCFANYLINIPCIGFNSQYGLGKSSITKAGKQRGCSEYYIAI